MPSLGVLLQIPDLRPDLRLRQALLCAQAQFGCHLVGPARLQPAPQSAIELLAFLLFQAQGEKWCQFIFRLPFLPRCALLNGRGRLARPIADGLVYHALNRGNNRQVVFAREADFHSFLRALRQTRDRYPFHLYAYCLLSNHFHLVLAPQDGQSISRVLQSLSVAHTWHYHRRQSSSGHVWQGRFKSPLIQQDEHLLAVLRYVESNPLRAGLVADLRDWPWSSYAVHAGLAADELVSAAPVWGGLGKSEPQRQAFWRRWLHTPLTEKELAGLRRSVVSGRPFGSAAWVKHTAGRLGLQLAQRPRGRPRKQPEK
jgi:putative transposase